MARTYRNARSSARRTLRDGKVFADPRRGSRLREGQRHAAKKTARQAGRVEIRAQVEDILLDQRLEAEAAVAASHQASEDRWQAELAEMRRWEAEQRQRYIDEGDHEGLFLFDNPAYAKWLERKEEREAMAA